MKVKTTLLLLMALSFSVAASAQCNGATFEEQNGIVVIQAENVNTVGSWQKENGSGATGNGFIVWRGGESFQTPGIGTLTYKIKINSTGTYRFKWRSRIGIGSNNTEHNDTWVKFPDASNFYGQRGSSRIFPRGSGSSGPFPEGSSAQGWFKVFMNSLNWDWRARTSDNDGHDIFVVFNSPGVYTLQLSARSRGHFIDRLVLYKPSQYTNAQSENINLGQTLCGSGGGGNTGGGDTGGGDTGGGDTGGGGNTGGGSNNPPTVAITSPTSGQTIATGSNVAVQLNANDSDGSINRHRIFVNGTLVDTDGSSYTPHVINSITAGSYTVRAEVRDNDGAIEDTTVSFTVSGSGGGTGGGDTGGGDTGGGDTGGGSGNSAPTVSIVSPANGQNVAVGSDVRIQLSTNDSDGSVTRHQIFVNGSLVDTDGANYTPHPIFNIAAGSYSVRALVTDNDGATAETTVNFTAGGGGGDTGGGDTGGGGNTGDDNDTGVVRFILVNADANTDIGEITPGRTFDAGSLPENLSIRAETNPGDVNGILMSLSGPFNFNGSEGQAPYNLFGDRGVDPFGRPFPSGNYTISANPGIGDPLTRSFTIGSGSSGGSDGGGSTGGGTAGTTSFTLVNALSDSDVRTLTNGATITNGQDRNIRANSTLDDVSSAYFVLSGPLSRTQVENVEPFALFGDEAGDYLPESLPNGAYTLRVTFYTGPNQSGTALRNETINFTVGDTSGRSVTDLKAVAYPNPTPDGTLSVKFPRAMGAKIGYNLMSPAGQLISSGVIENPTETDAAELQLPALQNSQEGIYYLIVTDGGQSYTIPVIRK